MALSNKRKKELEERWKKSKKPSGFRKVPEGSYQAEVKTINFNEDKCVIKWTLQIITGTQKGVKLSRQNNLLYESKTGGNSGMDFFKGDIEACGISMPSMDKLNKTLKNLIGQVLEVTVADQKNNPNFQNVYINKAINAAEDNLDDEDEVEEVVEEEVEAPAKEAPKETAKVADDDEDWEEDEEEDDEWEE